MYKTSELKGQLSTGLYYDFSENQVDSGYTHGDTKLAYFIKSSSSNSPLYLSNNHGLFKNYRDMPFDMVETDIPQWDSTDLNNEKELEVKDVIVAECKDGYVKMQITNIYYQAAGQEGYSTGFADVRYIFFSRTYNSFKDK